MKSTPFFSILITALSLTTACTEPAEPVPTLAPQQAAADVLALIDQRVGPRPRTYAIDARAGGTITGASIAFTIPPGGVLDAAGNPATGPISLSLREFQSVGDMVRGRRPTVERPSRGATGRQDANLLASSGAFELQAVDQAGRPVQVPELQGLTFRQWGDQPEPDMELWIAGAQDDGWARPTVEGIPARVGPDSYDFDSAPVGRQLVIVLNCDKRIWRRRVADLDSGFVTLKVQLAPEFTASAGVFFLPTGSPVAARLYTKDLGLPGFVSYDNMLQAGTTGKLIVVSLVDGHYYLYHDDAYTLPAGDASSAGVNEATVSVTPVELSEADLMAFMAGL